MAPSEEDEQPITLRPKQKRKYKRKKEPNYITGEGTNLMKDPKTDKRSKEYRNSHSSLSRIHVQPKLSEDKRQQIFELTQQGISASKIAKEFGVSSALVYLIRKQKRTKPEVKQNLPWSSGPNIPPVLERLIYECENAHKFKSNLPLDRVICPGCGSRDIDSYKEPEVREEVNA